jgi:hypothetical protein
MVSMAESFCGNYAGQIPHTPCGGASRPRRALGARAPGSETIGRKTEAELHAGTGTYPPPLSPARRLRAANRRSDRSGWREATLGPRTSQPRATDISERCFACTAAPPTSATLILRCMRLCIAPLAASSAPPRNFIVSCWMCSPLPQARPVASAPPIPSRIRTPLTLALEAELAKVRAKTKRSVPNYVVNTGNASRPEDPVKRFVLVLVGIGRSGCHSPPNLV